MNLNVRHYDLVDYRWALSQMQEFVAHRDQETIDEIWFLQHDPVFTQGQSGRAGHLHRPGGIPVVQSDRGGQVTYHGPGQLLAYTLIDIKRLGIGPRELVRRIEQSVIGLLENFDLVANRRPGAPGVYIRDAKIAALGLRIRRGQSYHGLSLNVDLDLEPFTRIDPCGYKGLRVTQMKDFGIDISCKHAAECLLPILINSLYGCNRTVEVKVKLPEQRETVPCERDGRGIVCHHEAMPAISKEGEKRHGGV
tara:strand:+ start:1119 stop:1871 length:753 start_codon:yes stop_codon:yes gene_type:complete